MVRRVAELVLIVLVGAMIAAAPARAAAATPVGCSTADLVHAIQSANATPAADTIKLARGCTYVFTTSTGVGTAVPEITAPLDIIGNNASIIRNSTIQFRMFVIAPGTEVSISRLTLIGGHALDGASSSDGQPGGAILNDGVLRLSHVALIANRAGDAGTSSNVVGNAGGSGGAIENSTGASLTVTKSRFVANGAGAASDGTTFGGHGGDGGAIDNEGSLSVRSSTFTENQAGSESSGLATLPGLGGAIFTRHVITIKTSKIIGNFGGSDSADQVVGSGGGIFNNSGSTINAKRTKIRGNAPDNCAGDPVRHCRG